MKTNERLQALHILTKLLTNKTPLTYLLQATTDLTPFTQELCFGVCRYFFQLQAIADELVKKRPKEIEVWLCLLIGLYQLHYLQTPDYAVVKETVALLDKIKKTWAKGLVNAVLRNYRRQQETLLVNAKQKPDFNFNHPQWFIQQLQRDWPKDWQRILTANDQHPPMNLRVNQRIISRESFLKNLEQSGIKATANIFAHESIELESPLPISALPGFSAGQVSVQDAAAQLAANLLDLKPGLRVLDACCAPGGKTSHILETEPDLATLTALDIDAKRLQRVQENLDRLQLSAHLMTADAARPQSWWDGKLYDRILLDAPCTALGIIRRHPDIKLIRTENDLKDVIKTQAQLLTTLWHLLAPQGVLVYATCSIMKDENERQIANFLSQTPNCQLKHIKQILPGEANMDGFFYAVCKKIDV